MIGISVNPNSVYISTVPAGCLKTEFDSTYPIHLNGIISPDEFQESINRINHIISSKKTFKIFALIFGLSVVCGMILFITGGITAANSRAFGFPPLIGVGMAIFAIGPIVAIIGCITTQFRRLARMRQVIADESMKYSSRSPTPCSWRLETTAQYVGGYDNDRRTRVVYHLVIDIGRSTSPQTASYYSNQTANASTSLYGRQDNAAPPPYTAPSSAGFCSQCGAVRQDSTARFCSSCGYAFNKY